jgi:NADPH:quinone reductase-like Zn-dependent oxidoreductase
VHLDQGDHLLDMFPSQMAAVLLTGHGGFDKLEYRTDVPVPKPGEGEVLIRVGATAINNTDINTRVGWYSKAVKGGTDSIGATGAAHIDEADAAWTGAALSFPRIQGGDCCGKIVATGEGVPESRVGERVLVRNLLRAPVGFRPFESWTFGSECNGSFAQFATAPSDDTFCVESNWSDAELASIPCAYSTAENMLHRTKVVPGETVLITGASGGVGSAAVQLARRRGARIIAVTSESKRDAIRALGADQIVLRETDLFAAIGPGKVDVVIDMVGGDGCIRCLEVLKPGGRYAIAGAIAGPIATLDLRTIYLRDLTVFGCTFQDDAVFANLIGYIERNEIRPLVSKIYPLASLKQAQQDFLEKGFIGKLVLTPPSEQDR